MCLQNVFIKSDREEMLAKLPEEFTIWKVVNDYGRNHKHVAFPFPGKYRYSTDCKCIPVHAGEMKFETNGIPYCLNKRYKGGGHFWLHKKDAEDWRDGDSHERVVRCRVKKKWITNVGIQDVYGIDRTVIVTSRAIFPKYIGQVTVIVANDKQENN